MTAAKAVESVTVTAAKAVESATVTAAKAVESVKLTAVLLATAARGDRERVRRRPVREP
jgi:hypothetical protein